MSKSWLEIVFPVGLALLVCTMGIFLLSVGGLLTEPEPADAAKAATSAYTGVELGSKAKSKIPSGANPVDVVAGDALFKGNCAQCHAVTEVLVGPALHGITKRRPVSWLIPWVKNSSKMVASGDEYAVKVFNQYQKQQMPSFQLSDREIKQILAYVESDHAVAQSTYVLIE
ncbi:c-type cytochrome [Hymenobacter weizhouensis]|uniref:c-type cytochrome n=1 Tax=Hymenobacter sp. YIM 151500-1 TaxID=2987689 RepID=UPI00222800BC|nr:cytochrome c [Hymenobacter sp. YIM 151500-1]UYZ64671.1 cytochrome c [Hymenobacter sp. YIM 151500-1]